MSTFAKLFGSSKKHASPQTPSEAIQRLLEVEEMLQKKSDFLEQKIEHEILVAKKNGSKNKQAALQALRRKQRYSKQLQQVDGTLSTVEFQRAALESASTNTEVLHVMSDASKALKSAQQNMNTETVHGLLDEIAEQRELSDELSDALASSVGFSTDVTDDEILAELEQLERETEEEELSTVSLPSVPADEPTAVQPLPSQGKHETAAADDEMVALAAWAS